MPMEAKVSFLNEAEKALSTEITAADLIDVMRILADVFQGYDITKIVTGEIEADDLLECYLNAQKVRGLSEKTIERYRYKIGKLMDALKIPTRQVTVHHVRGWMAKEQARGISDGTLRGDRSIFLAYFGWLHREGLIERNPVGNLDPIKCQKKKKKVYSAVEMEKLDDECDESNFRYALRNRAIVSFLESTGCRISEMTALDRDDINLNTLEVVVNGNGNKQRKVYMSEVTGMLLKEYLDSRKDNEPCLFVGAQLERFHPGGVRAMLNKLAKYADVEHVHPHKFRRTLATSLNRRGMPIEQVAAILGHEKLDTTMQYVVLNDEDTKNYYRRFT